ncbi:MAG: 23S rRNA (uracil(1939)-C(5))-methyltransferase RlmD [Acholeplasmatales bacterium]|nr:23S rRNA (uracil(1939)-C(5))-methyltransferase RlmD [Acholeplasmatales bacterium]
MKKNDYIDLTCTYLSTDAKGVCNKRDFCFYVDYLLPNEKANVIVEKINGKTVYARLMDIMEKSVDRIDSNCSSYMKCGSCKLLHLKYTKQLEFKKNNISLLFKNKGIKAIINDVIGMNNPFNYRNKVIASISLDNKKIVYGMYEENSHEVVYNKNCLIQNKLLNEILISIKEELDKLKIKPEGFGGVLRHIMLRVGIKTNEVLVVFVTNNDLFPGRNELVKALTKKHKEIKTIIQNTNPRITPIVFGNKDRILFGQGFINDELLSIKYKISHKSFYQVNPIQTEILYSKAINMAKLKETDTVLDCYSGIGTISLTISKKVKEVIGVEIVKEAVNDAINNAKINNIKNVRFILDDCKKFMNNYHSNIDCLFVDPPRSGLDREFINSVKRLKPKKIVYISCNPITQVDDIYQLLELYEIKEIQPVDLFPHTIHCENIVLLEKK